MSDTRDAIAPWDIPVSSQKTSGESGNTDIADGPTKRYSGDFRASKVSKKSQKAQKTEESTVLEVVDQQLKNEGNEHRYERVEGGELSPVRASLLERADLRPWMKRYLDSYAQTGLVGVACRSANVSAKTVQHWRQKWPDFDQACEEAAEEAVDIVEQAARSRAVDGVRRLKFDAKGQPLIDPQTGKPYEERQYSDDLAKFLLRGRRPDVYGDKSKVEVSGGLTQVVITADDLLSLQERRAKALKKVIEAEGVSE